MYVTHCRVCEAARLEPFLDLGTTALANSYLDSARLTEREAVYPLRAVFCHDCGLVQIDEEVPPEDLFRHYLYVSGTSDLVHRHARFLAEHFAHSGPLSAGDLVVEAASNDGTVLKAFAAWAVRVLGVEPARNIAAAASGQGILTLPEFFNTHTAQAVRERHGPAKLVLS